MLGPSIVSMSSVEEGYGHGCAQNIFDPVDSTSFAVLTLVLSHQSSGSSVPLLLQVLTESAAIPDILVDRTIILQQRLLPPIVAVLEE